MKNIESLPTTTISGRRFTRRQLAKVQETVELFKNLSRTELTLTVCEHLDWRTPKGTLKLESCRKLLSYLEEHDVVTLPAKVKQKAHVSVVPAFEHPPDTTPIQGPLSKIAPVSLKVVSKGKNRERWKAYLQAYHYLEYKRPFGAHLGYLLVSEKLKRDLGCLVFSASASWALAPRDRWIGWDEAHRKKLLSLILSNDRFLLFPWVNVPHLASHVLSMATGQIASDWVNAHGYRPVLIETFVDPTRFSGTCYQAANWVHLGQTQGRGRGDTRHEQKKTKKDIYVCPLRSDWQTSLTQGHWQKDIKKRYRNDLASSHTRSVGEDFIALWGEVVEILHEVAAEYDKKWRVRKRVIDSLILVLLIFRMVCSKNSQSYGTTIDDLWDSCDRLNLSLPQKNSIAPSSFCAARKKLDETIFRRINAKILQAYATERDRHRWQGHRLFAVDGSKVNLPRNLVKFGYPTPNKSTHYPQGLVSCLYEIRSQLPYDFNLVPHSNERLCAQQHLRVLTENDVVVYDRGYYSYAMLHHHNQSGIHAIFRLQENSNSAIREFFAGRDTDKIITISPSSSALTDFQKRHPSLTIVPLKMRLLKYDISGSTICLGTTLVESHQRYSIQDFMEVYHSRWGVEELFKVSKCSIDVEDFHAKSERGVKQELFAHFALITMTRLFANRADLELNGEGPPIVSPDSTEHDSSSPDSARLQTNFKNCLHVVQRSLEELLLLNNRMRTTVKCVFDTIVGRYQRVRPHRSFPRESHKTGSRWRPSKEKRLQRKKELAAAAST